MTWVFALKRLIGYDAAAAFEIYRIRNNGDIFVGPNQSGSDFIFQINKCFIFFKNSIINL